MQVDETKQIPAFMQIRCNHLNNRREGGLRFASPTLFKGKVQASLHPPYLNHFKIYSRFFLFFQSKKNNTREDLRDFTTSEV